MSENGVYLTRRSGETRTIFTEDFFRERWSSSQVNQTSRITRKNKTASRIQNIVTENYHRCLCLRNGLEGDTQIRTSTTWLVEFPTVNTSKIRHPKKKPGVPSAYPVIKQHAAQVSTCQITQRSQLHNTLKHVEIQADTAAERKALTACHYSENTSHILKGTKLKT